MAKNKTYEFLEIIQEQVYKSLPNNDQISIGISSEVDEKFINAFLEARGISSSDKKYKELRDGIIQEIQNSKSKTPTKYEDPHLYKLLYDLDSQIQSAAKELSIDLPTTINFGTLPTGRVNAMAVRVPTTNEYLVLFESELFTFALLFSKAIAAAFQEVDSDRKGYLSFSTNPNDIKKSISENREPIYRFLDVLLAYLFTGHPSSAEQYFANSSIQTISQIIYESMELFVLGHEYGHVIKGHLSTNALHMAQLGSQEVSEITRSWQQEFEADVMGLQFMLHARMKKGMDISLSFWGADFFFSCIEVIYRSIAIFHGVEYSKLMSSSVSHPPPEMRREFIRKVLKNSLSGDESDGPIQLAQNIELVTKILMESATPILKKMKEDGKQLYPTWQNI